MPLILASTSRIRQHILSQAGLTFTAQASQFDEAAWKQRHKTLDPQQLAQGLAFEKARSVSIENPQAVVIGADQTLSLAGQLFDKPKDISQAKSQLLTLKNHTHHLHSALSVCRNGEEIWSYCESPELQMRDFSETFLDHYIASQGADILSSVGAYKLEGLGIQLFKKITGDYFAILGLPLLPLLHYLRESGEMPL